MISFLQKLDRRAKFINSNTFATRAAVSLVLDYSFDSPWFLFCYCFRLLLLSSYYYFYSFMNLLDIKNPFRTKIFQTKSILIQYTIIFQSDLRNKFIIGGSYRREFGMIIGNSFKAIHLEVDLLAWTEFDKQNILINWTELRKSSILIINRHPF